LLTRIATAISAPFSASQAYAAMAAASPTGAGSGAAAGSGELSKEELRAAAKRAAGPWLNAWHDTVANVKAFSPCVRLADLNATGEYLLLIADADKKLKVYKGTSLASEHALLDVPSALATFYTDLNKPQTPSVAVAAGSYIFIYRNLRPYYKFTLPPVDIAPVEQEVWAQLRAGKLEVAQALEQLGEARDNGVELSTRSINLLALAGSSLANRAEADAFVASQKALPLVQLTVATCMETLNKNMSGERAISSLVVGTESRHILIMEPSGTAIAKKFLLPSVPVFLAVQGTMDVEYRIVAACRNGNIYQIKKGKLLGTVIELETQCVGLVLLEKSMLVGCMDGVIHSFHFKGKKNYSIYCPEPICSMELLSLTRIKSQRALLVALNNGEIRLYNKKHLLHTLLPEVSQGVYQESVTAMRFGPYGREEASLILAYKSGALTIKMLQRQADLEVQSTVPGPPPEQDIPLNVPKKTKLYVEQTQREREQAVDMHRIFQRDLCKLRLSTARSFVKVITDGVGPLSSTGSTSLRLDAKVAGLGPLFKLRLALKNTGLKALVDIPLSLSYNPAIYRVRDDTLVSRIPVLVPGVEYAFDIGVECIDPMGAADPIRVFVLSSKSAVPSISAIVNMPMSEIPDKDE